MKKLLIGGLILMSTACADFQQSVNENIKAVNAALTPKSSGSGQSTASATQKGTITNEQCKTSVGQTKSYFEQLLDFKLNETNAYSYTSFSETYNLKISDRKDRLGNNFAMCMISIDPRNGKVTDFSMPF
ncbi:hypothetical protein [Pantoea rwandensis]|uniref:Lipoprotein n=1 Tax=Pantoea rwandensis TaxID=1076550 RepID=A0A1X1D323_9GAMM|nr:hypothetical protein [Pantoea rwandensis]ORM71047.1 hypothetical protein HA51_03900 [Pantoea rwandensis]